MAARKITVTHNGAVIGTRKTERTYTHAVCSIAFDEAAYMNGAAIANESYAVRDTENHIAHARQAMGQDYKYASSYSDEQRAKFAADVADPAAYMARRRALLDKADQDYAARLRQPHVVSWHHSAALAHKALAAAPLQHRTLVVLPVDQA